MSKVQEYLKKKKIQELGLPKLYVVKSSGAFNKEFAGKADGKLVSTILKEPL